MELEESKREMPVIQVFARLAPLSHTALSVNSYLSPAKPSTQQNPLDRILCSSWKGRLEETLRNLFFSTADAVHEWNGELMITDKSGKVEENTDMSKNVLY